MLFIYVLPFLIVLATMGLVQPTMAQDVAEQKVENSRVATDWVRQGLMDFVEVPFSTSKSTNEARKKKKHKLNKYLVPLIIGFILIKSILLPVALKTLAILSGKAVILSLMSLILAAIVGLKRIAQSSPPQKYEIVNSPSSKYRRQDMYDLAEEDIEREPYKYYRERRRKK